MTHEDNVKSVRTSLAAMHMGALQHGESLVHMIGLVAVQARRHGSQVWFYVDGKRVSRADATEQAAQSMAKAERIADRIDAAGIKQLKVDTDELTKGFHTGGLVGTYGARGERPSPLYGNVGTVGHRDLPVIIDTERTLPHGKYDGVMVGFDGKRFDVVVVDDIRDIQRHSLDEVREALGFAGRCIKVAFAGLENVGKAKLLKPATSVAEYRQVSGRIDRKPRRNHGPRNRWGKLI